MVRGAGENMGEITPFATCIVFRVTHSRRVSSGRATGQLMKWMLLND